MANLLGGKFPEAEMLSSYVAARIKDEIKKAGMTQEQVALALNKDPSWLSAKLKQLRNLTVDEVGAISRVINVSAATLLPAESNIDLGKMSFIDVVRAICLDAIRQDKKESENAEASLPGPLSPDPARRVL